MRRRTQLGNRVGLAAVAALVAANFIFQSPIAGLAHDTVQQHSPTELIGAWKGEVAGVSPPVPITVNITGVELGEKAGMLHFGGARACRLEIAYSGPDDASYYFTTERPTGGYCDQLDFGSLEMHFFQSPTEVAFTVTTRSGTATDNGKLSRAKVSDGQASALIGSWKGQVDGQRPPVPLTVTITDVALDEPAGSLHFGGARACRLDMDYAGPVNSSDFFTLKRPTGGYCTQLDFGTLDLQSSTSPDSVKFSVAKQDGSVTDDGTLTKSQ